MRSPRALAFLAGRRDCVLRPSWLVWALPAAPRSPAQVDVERRQRPVEAEAAVAILTGLKAHVRPAPDRQGTAFAELPADSDRRAHADHHAVLVGTERLRPLERELE